MEHEIVKLKDWNIQNKIYSIRGCQVMFDSDLAELYGVDTKVLNQAVKRNKERFPQNFCFTLNNREIGNLKSQIVTSSWGGKRKLPRVFTEQGVAMLAGVLKSKIAVKISIQIIDTFVRMRKIISGTSFLSHRVDRIENRQLEYKIETDTKFEKVFSALESNDLKPKQGIFFDGQMFDAYVFVSDLIKRAEKSIILIDNYIDETVLILLSKRKRDCQAIIYTNKISKKLKLDLIKHNEQNPAIEIKQFKNSHDRFLILDEKDVYHIGASLKDMGKKWFAFSKLDQMNLKIMERLN